LISASDFLPCEALPPTDGMTGFNFFEFVVNLITKYQRTRLAVFGSSLIGSGERMRILTKVRNLANRMTGPALPGG
jgi:hypothetical protein